MADRAALKSMAASGDVRLSRLLDYNLRFALEVHPERRKNACPALDDAAWERIAACGRAVTRLSLDPSWLAADLPPAKFELPDPSGRVALLPWADLQKGLFWFGAAVRFQAVKRCVDGSELRRIADVAGREARDFAVNRGGLMVGNRVRELFPDNPELGLYDRVEWVAAGALSALTRPLDPAFGLRLREAAPPAFERRMNSIRDYNPAERRLLWLALKNVLVGEALPQWAKFFI